jgi:peptidyl-prolyl cis-trans isomerase B (cyclophilin B)
MIILKTTFGEIEIKLDEKNTPNTAANFLKYVKKGFFDGTIFHRVIKGFMIQGGGFEPGMKEKKENAKIENEADKGKSNKRGTIAMARTSDPHSATAQFFINVADNPFLDHKSKDADGWGYCVFGEVTKGMDVVDKIQLVQTTNKSGHGDVPVEDITIEQATFVDDPE